MLQAFVFRGIACCVTHLNVQNSCKQLAEMNLLTANGSLLSALLQYKSATQQAMSKKSAAG